MPQIESPVSTTRPDALTLKAALDSERDALAQLEPSELVATPGLDPATATAIAIGSLPLLEKQRAAVVRQFGEAGAAVLDRVPAVAYAAEQANVELAAADSQSDLTDTAAEIGEAHTLLFTDCQALANRGLLDRNRVEQARSIHGYRALVKSTLVLVSLLREHWDRVSHKTPVTIEDLDRIEASAQAFLRTLNEREQGANRAPAIELRARALSLLVRTYGEARRMIAFVRYWEGDADQIAPSLWSGRRGRSRAGDEPEIPETPIVPAGPGPSIGGSPFTS